MSIAFDQQYAKEVGHHFGRYHATFISDGGQVMAHLFEEGDQLVAYVYFEGDLTPETVTDSFLSPLQEYAANEGFAGRFTLRYT
jgi:hypothetical protein